MAQGIRNTLLACLLARLSERGVCDIVPKGAPKLFFKFPIFATAVRTPVWQRVCGALSASMAPPEKKEKLTHQQTSVAPKVETPQQPAQNTSALLAQVAANKKAGKSEAKPEAAHAPPPPPPAPAPVAPAKAGKADIKVESAPTPPPPPPPSDAKPKAKGSKADKSPAKVEPPAPPPPAPVAAAKPESKPKGGKEKSPSKAEPPAKAEPSAPPPPAPAAAAKPKLDAKKADKPPGTPPAATPTGKGKKKSK